LDWFKTLFAYATPIEVRLPPLLIEYFVKALENVSFCFFTGTIATDYSLFHNAIFHYKANWLKILTQVPIPMLGNLPPPSPSMNTSWTPSEDFF
jgi:hypothetical protein